MATNKLKLTKTAIEKLTATDKRVIVWDSSITGYGIRVMPTGAKTYFYQARLRGELIRITIGKYPALNPELARKKAQEIQGQVAVGTDPRPERQKADAATLGDLMTAYVDLLESQGKKDARPVRNQIKKDIEKAFPKLWKKRVVAIDLDDCMAIVGKLKDEGKPRQADKIRSYIRTAFSEAINSRGDVNMPASMRLLDIKFNPARDMRKVKGSSEAKDRALSVAEFQAYWRHVQELPEPKRSLAALHVLTGGQRQQQLARTTINDIDRDSPSLTLMDYKGRRTTPRVHVIPLLPEALEAIDRITGTGQFIFSCDGGLNPVNIAYLNEAVKQICSKMEVAGELEKGTFTAGSIRATIETRLMKTPYRVSSDVLAYLLSHGMGTVQRKHYQHEDLFDEKLEALQMVYRLAEGLPEPNKEEKEERMAEVIPMKRRAQA